VAVQNTKHKGSSLWAPTRWPLPETERGREASFSKKENCSAGSVRTGPVTFSQADYSNLKKIPATKKSSM